MARQNNYPIFENNSTVITAEFLNGLVNNVKTLNQEDGVFDISIANAVSGVPITYNSLELALSGTSVPVDVRKGGMAVKFINSGTGKYEQWNLKASSWSTNTSDWALDIDGSVTDGKLKLPFELKRPNAGTPVTNATEIDYGTDENKQPLNAVIEGMPSVAPNQTGAPELEITDEDGNAVVQFPNGEIVSKNFNSANTPNIDNAAASDFAISDERGNIIVSFQGGHIKTKNFDSSDIKPTPSPEPTPTPSPSTGFMLIKVY